METKSKKPTPFPNEHRAAIFRQVIIEITEWCKQTENPNIQDWCLQHGLSDNSFRSWRAGNSNISPENLVKLYKATEDQRFLVTAEERVIYGMRYNHIPPESEWPSLPVNENEDVQPSQTDDDLSNMKQPLQRAIKAQVNALLAMHEIDPRTVRIHLNTLKRFIEPEQEAEAPSIYDLLEAIDKLQKIVTMLPMYNEKHYYIVSFIYMTVNIVELLLSVANEKEEKEKIQSITEMTETVLASIKDPSNQLEEGYLTPMKLILENLYILYKYPKPLQRQIDYISFGVEDTLKLIKRNRELEIPEWFSEWLNVMNFAKDVLGGNNKQ